MTLIFIYLFKRNSQRLKVINEICANIKMYWK